MSGLFRPIWIEADSRFIGAPLLGPDRTILCPTARNRHLNIIEADSVRIVSDVPDLNWISIWLFIEADSDILWPIIVAECRLL